MVASSKEPEARWSYYQLVKKTALSRIGQLYPPQKVRELTDQGLAGYLEVMADRIQASTDAMLATWWCEQHGYDFNTKFFADVDEEVARLKAQLPPIECQHCKVHGKSRLGRLQILWAGWRRRFQRRAGR